MTSISRVLINGREESVIAVSDRGLQYGDGVFRTVLVRDSRPVYLDRHIKHLANACERLGFTAPDWKILEQRVIDVCSDVKDGVLKIILTRGGAKSRGYRPLPAETTEILQLHSPSPGHPVANWKQGISVRVCGMRLSINPVLAGIKHLNRLEQVLARAEWNDGDFAEGLMLDTAGNVIEATACNLFLVKQTVLYTPDLSGAGVAGVMREMILDAAPAYTKAVCIKAIKIEDCVAADEIFLSNAVIGIWPVRQLLDHTWAAGPVTRTLQDHFVDVRR